MKVEIFKEKTNKIPKSFNNALETTKNQSEEANDKQKIEGFFKALNFISKKSVEGPSSSAEKNRAVNTHVSYLSSYGNQDVSEYSRTNAHFSREDHDRYRSLEKGISIINNNIVRKHKKSISSANEPYRFEYKLKQSLMEEIKEEAEEDVKVVEAKHEIRSATDKPDKLGCYSAFGSINDKLTRSTNAADKDLQTKTKHDSNFPKYDDGLDDLDIEEDKISLNTLDHRIQSFNISCNEDDNYDKSILVPKLNLNLDHYHHHQYNDSKNQINFQANSKIFIIDSNNRSYKPSQNNSIINNMKYQKNSKNLIVPKLTLNNLRQQKEDFNDSLEIIKQHCDFYIDLNDDKSSLVRTRLKQNPSKKLRKKYQKSEIFDKKQKNEEIKKILLDTNKAKRTKSELFENSQKVRNRNSAYLINKNFYVNYIENNGETIKRNLLENFNKTSKDTSFTENLDKTPKTKLMNLTNQNSLMYIKEDSNNNSINNLSKHLINNTSFGNLNQSQQRLTIIGGNVNQSHQGTAEDYSTVCDLDFINNLLENDRRYSADPFYMMRHPEIDAEARALLIDWLFELSEEFEYKRDTIHYAINYIDRFLSKTTNEVNLKSLQLVGITAISISAKFEEVQIPKMIEYVISTSSIYSLEELLRMEKIMLNVLKWEIMPPTLMVWLNWYLAQWDLFIDSYDEVKMRLSGTIYTNIESIDNDNELDGFYFKKSTEEAYQNYRRACQLVDLFSLDLNHLKFNRRFLVASSIFLVLSKFFISEIFSEFNFNKFCFDLEFYSNLIQQSSDFPFIEIFEEFLKLSFNLKFDDIMETLVYVSKFFSFECTFNLPSCLRNKNIDISQIPYEEFLSFQTHDEKSFQFIQPFLK